MNSRSFFAFFFLFISLFCVAQDEDLFKANTIPIALKDNANAVVRYDENQINVHAYNKFTLTMTRIITILNSNGDDKHGGIFGYNSNINIKKLEAKIYNANGEEIKKIKKNDFKDYSAVDGATLYSDSRIKYLDYTPTTYPYTIRIHAEIDYGTTAFFPDWRVIDGFYASTQFATYKITNNSDVKISIKTYNFDEYNIEKHSDFYYTAKNLKAIKPEAYGVPFNTYAPFLKATLQEFEMEGVPGVNTNWKDFGKWIHDKLVLGNQELPESAKAEISKITVSAKTDIEKAKIIYKYLQDKTRYISVQVGIGGWKPVLAKDVDRLGYGDCKGLTNYTKAMLDYLGVPSYYTVIYGGQTIRDIDKDFSTTEGNHAILSIPQGDDYIWLECTNQTAPFGYNANFTDDRDALVITPEGGKIVHTKIYTKEENRQITNAKVRIDLEGHVSGDVIIKSSGAQYGYHEGLQYKTLKDRKSYYKKHWNNINNINIGDIKFSDDKHAIVFTEDLSIAAENYATKSGELFLFQPNLFNMATEIPPRYAERILDFEIERGYSDYDEFEIHFDEGLKIKALPEPVDIKNKFGEYAIVIEKTTENSLIYRRHYIVYKGQYSKEEYDDFRDFKRDVVKHDNSKIALIKI